MSTPAENALRRFLSRWRIFPTVSYTNFHKEYPQSRGIWKPWFSVRRYWSGKIVNVNIRHHQVSFDFRRNALADFINPNR